MKINLSNYDQQIIINFEQGMLERMSGETLVYKWEKSHNHKSCPLINVLPKDDLTVHNSKFAELACPKEEKTLKPKRVRIYLIFHHLANQEGRFKNLAAFLALYLKDDPRLIQINLIACQAGRAKEGKDFSFDSYAADFHRTLRHEYKINTEVIARCNVVGVNSLIGGKTTLQDGGVHEDGKPIFFLMHKRPGSKVAFSFDESGDQVMKDAYAFSWLRETLEVIQKLAKNITNKEKAEECAALFAECCDKEPQEVLKILTAASGKKDSFFDKHEFRYAFWTTKTRKELDNQIRKGNYYLNHDEYKPVTTQVRSAYYSFS